VLRDRLHADRERRGELGDSRLASVGETGEDLPPGRVGEGGERGVEISGIRIQLLG
jgi:hypothetical protein